MGYKVAIVGATGNVGREILQTLYERKFPADEVIALASERSIGRKGSFGENEPIEVRSLADYNFEGTDIAMFSPGAKVSAVHATRAASKGCIVIDNTSQFRMESDVPLVVPEVNPEAISGYSNRNIISNPNCSTIQMVVALKPIHDAFDIKRVVVSTYQSTSGAGKEAMDELFNQTRAIFVNDRLDKKEFTKQIAFNVIPQIDVFMEDGSTKEEWKMVVETKKILDENIDVTATCVRVPVFIGHAESINIDCKKEVTTDAGRKVLRDAEGVSLIDHRADEGYVTPVEAAGDDLVFVSRVRDDFTIANGLNLWVVSDNLRKGAALNTVQIAELLDRKHLNNLCASQ